MGVERLCEGEDFQIPFNADEINLIYQFGEKDKVETCASLSAILLQIRDSGTKQIVSDTLKKLNALPEKTCAEQTAALYTGDKAVMRKLDTLVADFPDTYKRQGGKKYLRPIPFRNHMSATASLGQPTPNRGNGQGSRWLNGIGQKSLRNI